MAAPNQHNYVPGSWQGHEAGTPSRHSVMLGQTVVEQVALYPRITDQEEFKAGLERLRGHINDIASDSRGSHPGAYVSDSDLAFLNKLKTVADHHMKPPWKKATPITHVDRTRHWIRRQKSPREPVLDSAGRPVVGYRVGYLCAGQFETPVLFCSDGNLRMFIKHHDPKGPHLIGANAGKTYEGYCRLPEPKYLYPVRTRGTMSGVTFKHGQTHTLRSELKQLTGFPFDRL